YKWALLTHLARGYAKRDWAMQLHFAAQRDNNHRMHRLLGPDTGYDSIGPGVNLPALAAFLDGLDETGELPRTILYSLEPSDNAALVALMGCFQGPGTAGRLQHGSA
ncbi:glucuronate isomerase, partial [[Clostridium] symbiosum]